MCKSYTTRRCVHTTTSETGGFPLSPSPSQPAADARAAVAVLNVSIWNRVLAVRYFNTGVESILVRTPPPREIGRRAGGEGSRRGRSKTQSPWTKFVPPRSTVYVN